MANAQTNLPTQNGATVLKIFGQSLRVERMNTKEELYEVYGRTPFPTKTIEWTKEEMEQKIQSWIKDGWEIVSKD